MSFGGASQDQAKDRRLSSLHLIGGNECSLDNSRSAVDLRVQGGTLINKSLCVMGNINAGGMISGEFMGNLITGKIQEEELMQGIQVIGNLNMDSESFFKGNVIVPSSGSICTPEIKETIVGEGVTITSNANVVGTLTVQNNAQFDCNVNIDKNLSVLSNVDIGGIANILGDTIIGGNLNVDTDTTLCGSTLLKGTLEVQNTATFQDILVNGEGNVVGNLTVSKDLSVDGDGEIMGHLVVCGTTTLKGVVTAQDTVTVEDLVVNGNVLILGNTTEISTQTLTIEDNKVLINSFGATEGLDSGICINRYQTENDICSGDVVKDEPQESSAVVSATASTVTLSPPTTRVDDYYNDWYIKITSGAGVNQVRKIIDFDGTTDIATIETAWTVTPSASDGYELFGGKFVLLLWDETDNKWIFGCTANGNSMVIQTNDLGDICVGNIETDNLFIGGDLDMMCNDIANVESVETNTLRSKDGGDLIIENGATIQGNIDVNCGIIGNSELVETNTIRSKDGGDLIIENGVKIQGNIDVNCGIIGNSELVETNTIRSKDGGDLILENGATVQGNIDAYCSNISNVQALFVDQVFGKNSPINFEDELNITSTGTKITFESGIEVGNTTTSATNSSDIAIGKGAISLMGGGIGIGTSSNVSGFDSISIGSGSQTADSYAIAIGSGAIASATDDIVFGRPSGAVDISGVATAWGQTFQNRAWDDTMTTLACIDGTGNFVKGGCSSSMTGNLDMMCYNVSNVQAMFVDQIYGKNSPINVEDTLVIKDNGTDTATLQFETGIRIGSAATGATNSTDIAVGKAANATGGNSVAFGQGAQSRGPNNIMMGWNAGNASDTGTDNIAIGRDALGTGATSGADNIAIGRQAGTNITVAHNNIIIGNNAGTSLTGGGYANAHSENVIIGSNCGTATNKRRQVCIGALAEVSTLSSYAVAVGARSSAAHYCSTAVGFNARCLASSATAIGRSTFINSPYTNAVALGYNITANQAGGFFVRHRAGGLMGNPVAFIPGTNELVETVSSKRYKQNIVDLEDVSDKFDSFRSVTYEPKPGHGDDRVHIGLIAEEVEEIFPELVTYNVDGLVDGIAFDGIHAINIKEIQSLRQRVALLESENAILKDKINQILNNLGL
jgi:predicted acyltransferase (DUF342 family)